MNYLQTPNGSIKITKGRLFCRLTAIIMRVLIFDMQYSVAFVNLHGQRLAIVEVDRVLVGGEQNQKQVQEQLSKVPQLQGYTVVLAVRPGGEFEAGFRAEPQLELALKKIGWLRLGFTPTELTLPN
jgi:hypothetical protein